jgi:hypothetical protein
VLDSKNDHDGECHNENESKQVTDDGTFNVGHDVSLSVADESIITQSAADINNSTDCMVF